MDHIVYIDSNELEDLETGEKTMIARGTMGKKPLFGSIEIGDTLYFIQSSHKVMIKGRAEVQNVFNSGLLTKEESIALVYSFKDKLMLDVDQRKRIRGKRYLTLITIKKFEALSHFEIDSSVRINNENWLLVGEIERVLK